MQPPDPSVPGGPEPVPPSAPFVPPPVPGIPPPDPAASTPPPPPPPAPETAAPAAGTPTFNFSFLPTPPFTPAPTSDERLWALILHLGGALGGFSAYVGVPGGSLLIPLIIWLVKKDASAFINDQGKEVLNFHLCILAVSIVCFLTCIGAILIYPIGIVALVLGIIGGIKAQEGATYRYPLNFRLIK